MPATTRSRLVHVLTMAFLYVTIASLVLPLFFMWPGIYVGQANLIDMVEGTARRPYVSRTLLPWIVKGVAITGERARAAAGVEEDATAVGSLGAFLLRRTKAPQSALEHAHLYGVYLITVFLCIVGFGLLTRLLIRLLYPDFPSFVADIAPAISMVVIPLVFFRYVNLMYDPMTLFMFTLCVYLIAARFDVAFLLAFPLAVLNKETAILLLPVFLLRGVGAISRAKLGFATLYLVAVYMALKVLLTYAFRGNPGVFVTFQFERNVQLLREPGLYVKTLGPVVPLLVLIAYGWRRKLPFLRGSFIVSAVPLVALSLFFGAIGEMRDFYELYPFVVLLALPAVMDVFGVEKGNGERAAEPLAEPLPSLPPTESVDASGVVH